MSQAEMHVHPKSGEKIFGTKLAPGERLLVTDVFSSDSGVWLQCPCPGLNLHDSKALWVRPLKPNAPRTANVILTACDGGQHGFASCGACGATLLNWVTTIKCPRCDVMLAGTSTGTGFGGSDFP